MGVFKTKNERVNLAFFGKLQLFISDRVVSQIVHNFSGQTERRNNRHILGLSARNKRSG